MQPLYDCCRDLSEYLGQYMCIRYENTEKIRRAELQESTVCDKVKAWSCCLCLCSCYPIWAFPCPCNPFWWFPSLIFNVDRFGGERNEESCCVHQFENSCCFPCMVADFIIHDNVKKRGPKAQVMTPQ